MPAETMNAPSFDAAVDAAFAPIEAEAKVAEAAPAVDTPGGSEPETPATPPEIVTADEQTQDTEAELQEAVPEPDAPVDPYEADLKPDSVSKDGKRFFFNKGKAERLMSADRTLQQIREIDPGFSVEQYQEMATRTLELDRMLNDYESGDPQKVALIASDFVSPGKRSESVAAFIDTAMANAAQHHPQAFQVVQNKILASQAQIYYNKYRQTGSAADKALAQNLDWLAKGAPANAIPGVHFIDPDSQQAPQDPLAGQRAELQRQQSEYKLQVDRDRQQRIQQAVRVAEDEAKSAEAQVIEGALNVIPANVRSAKALEYKHAVRDLQDQIEEARKANPIFSKQYQTALAAVQATPSDQTKTNLVRVVKQFADYVVGRSKKDVLGRFNSTVMDQNKTVHQKLAETSKRIEPGGGNNTPVQRAGIKQKLQDPKLSYEDKFDAVFGR